PSGARRSLQCAVPGATPRYARLRDAADTLRIVERIDPAAVPLLLFGAGHVGQALVRVLSGLPLAITWIDSRPEQVSARLDGLPENVTLLLSDMPEDEVAFAPAGAYCLVMTHSHDQDDQICRALLRRGDFAWVGLIGSDSKAKSFAGRWERRGFPPEDIARITCPIGVHGIESKHPAAIAIAVAAQLQQVIEAGAAATIQTPVRIANTAAAAHRSVVAQETPLLVVAIGEAASLAAAGPH
ncbi:MAG: xanthine dehydrogenase accessory protein XdhC, partial [Betaproteobacteria bacterium]|nr:xanthine dehydrogenase accessory protein XdhC [Betaproteobacteria bacterium]